MFFNIKYLTTAGKNLLDQATAGRTIIWGKCATSSRSYVSDEDPRNLTDIAVNGKYTSLGTVTAVDHGKIDSGSNANNSNLIIKASLENSGPNVESGEARAFGVWAKLGENGTEQLVIVAFWNLNEGNPETIPSYSQSKYSATVDLYVRTSDNVISTIDSTTSWATPLSEFTDFKETVESDLAQLKADTDNSELETRISTINNSLNKFTTTVNDNLTDLNDAMRTAISSINALNTFKTTATTDLNDLNNLKDRVVTTHSKNSTSTGDAQTIKGVKVFSNDVTFNGGTRLSGSCKINSVLEADNIQSSSVTCGSLNITGQLEDNFRIAIAKSLADSTNADDPVVGCMRLVAIPGRDINGPRYDRAGATYAANNVYPAAFNNGSFEVLYNDANAGEEPESYSEGTWMLVTDLAAVGTSNGSYSYALAVKIF